MRGSSDFILIAGPPGDNGRIGCVAMVPQAIEKCSPIRQSLCPHHEGGNMTKDEFCERALQELQRIESGETKVELVAGDILAGKVEYQTSSGWKIVVFSDGDVWDYVRTMIPPTEQLFEIWPEKEKDDCEGFRKIRAYHPPAAQLKTTWGFLS